MGEDYRFKWIGMAIAAAGLAASIAFAAATGDRLKTPVLVGQGTAVAESVAFDQGLGSGNPSVRVDAAGNLIATAVATQNLDLFSGAVEAFSIDDAQNESFLPMVLDDGGTFSGTITGAHSYSGGTVTFGSAVVNNGTVTMNTTGGNVPHGCTVRTATGGTGNQAVNCSAGEIVTGGGCSLVGSGAVKVTKPNGSTQWACQDDSGGTTVTAYAVCCSY